MSSAPLVCSVDSPYVTIKKEKHVQQNKVNSKYFAARILIMPLKLLYRNSVHKGIYVQQTLLL